MTRALLRLGAALLGSAASAAALAGQSGSSGLLEGRVADRLGGAVAHAEVSLQPLDGLALRQATTDSLGGFRLGLLPPGRYRLSVRRIGYRPLVVNEVAVRAGRVASLDLVLEPAALALDSLVVQAPAVQLNTRDTESGTRLTQRELSLLPLPDNSRQLVLFTPGARPDQIWGAATAQANNYELDGIAVNHPGLGGDFLEPAPSWIEEVEVKGLGAGAEYGNFQGGLVNIVTKSGSNRLEGQVRSSGESWHLNGSNLRVSEAGSEPSHRAELDAQLRGPLRHERLFFATFAQLVDRGSRVLNRVRQVPGDLAPDGPTETELKLLGKLTWQPGTRRDLLNLSIGRSDLVGERFGLDGFQSAEASARRRAATTSYNLSWQRNWSAGNFLELKLGGFAGSDRRDPYAGSTTPGIATLLEVNPRQYQNAIFRELRRPTSLALSLNWDVYARVAGVEHHLKLGGEQAFGSWVQQRLRNGGLTWRPGERLTPPVFDPAVPSTWIFNGVLTSSWGGEVRLDSKVQNGALFAQDYIRVSRRLSLNPGLRVGRWVGRLLRADGTGYFTPVRTTGFDPRLGVVLDLSGRGTLVAKAHWGIFHQSLFAGFFDRAEGGAVYSNEERWEYRGPALSDPTTSFSAAARDASSEWTRVQTIRLNEVGRVENFKEPYVEQASLGLEKSFGGRLSLGALYLRRRNRNMVAVVDRNLAQDYTVYRNVTVLDRFFRPIILKGEPLVLPSLAVSNQDIIYWRELVKAGVVAGSEFIPPGMSAAAWNAVQYAPDNVLTNVPEATRRLDQVQLTATARYPAWWAQGSVTLSGLDGNLNSLTGTDDYTTSGAGPFVRLNEQINFYGALNNQSRFELKLQGGARLPAGFQGGALLTYYEGDRVTSTLTLSDLLLEFQLPDTSSTGQPPARLRGFFFASTAGQRIFVEPRGTYRYPGRLSLDLHLERTFLAGGTELSATLDAFNALGAATVTEAQTSVNGSLDPDYPSTYGETRNRVPPRTLRIGVMLRGGIRR